MGLFRSKWNIEYDMTIIHLYSINLRNVNDKQRKVNTLNNKIPYYLCQKESTCNFCSQKILRKTTVQNA